MRLWFELPWPWRRIRILKSQAEMWLGWAKELEVENNQLRASLQECADDLESEIKGRSVGEAPRRIQRDLEPVMRARHLLSDED